MELILDMRRTVRYRLAVLCVGASAAGSCRLPHSELFGCLQAGRPLCQHGSAKKRIRKEKVLMNVRVRCLAFTSLVACLAAACGGNTPTQPSASATAAVSSGDVVSAASLT